MQEQHVRTDKGSVGRSAIILGRLVVGRVRDGDGAGLCADQVFNVALERVGAVVRLQATESKRVEILLDLLPGEPRQHDLLDLLSARRQRNLRADLAPVRDRVAVGTALVVVLPRGSRQILVVGDDRGVSQNILDHVVFHSNL